MYNRGGARGGGGRPMGGHNLLGRSPDKQRQGVQGRQAGGQMSTGMKRMLGGGGNRAGLLGNAPMANTDSMYNQDQQYDQSYDGQYDQNYTQGGDYGSGYGMDNTSGYGGQTDKQQDMYDRPSRGDYLNKGQARQGFNDGQARQGFNDGQARQGFNDGQARQGFNDGQTRQGFNDGQTRQGFNDGQTRQRYNEGQTRQGFQGQGSRRDSSVGRTMQNRQKPVDVYNNYSESDYGGRDYDEPMDERGTRGDVSDWDNYRDDQQGRVGVLLPLQEREFSMSSGNNSRNLPRGNESRNADRGNMLGLSERGRALLGHQEPTDTYSLLRQPTKGRGLLGQQEPRDTFSLLGQPTQGRGRGLLGQPAAVGLMNISQAPHGMMNRQTEMLQKAEMQMRMIQEEEREAVMMQQKLLQEQEQLEERRRAEDLRTLMETQQRALMMQQTEKQMRMGAGLLGDGPMSGGMQQGRGQQSGGIPSLFDVQGGRKQSLLGKRPSVAVARANIAAKRARQESQNRAANKPRRPSPKRGGRDKSRGSQRKSRFEQSPSSKSRDRKESESRKGSSSQTSGGNSSKDHGRSKRRESRGDNKVSTEVTVTTEEIYDPANPTEDAAETKDDDIQITGVEGPTKKTPGADSKQGEAEVPMETSLTVTVSKKGRSVNDSEAKGEQEKKELEKKYKCNVCNVKCYDEQSFSRHMNGMKHKTKMTKLASNTTQSASLLSARKQAEEHLRQIEAKKGHAAVKPQSKLPPGKPLESHCKVCKEMFTGAYKDHKEVPKHKAKEDRRKAGCKVCNVTSFSSYGDFLKHLDSAWHKRKQKQASWPECKICNQTFKSPRKFVLHLKTDHHMENKKKRGEDADPDDLGELVTLDTVGFEDESSADTGKGDSKKKDAALTPTAQKGPASVVGTNVKSEPTSPGKIDLEDEVLGEYDPNKAVGQKLVIAVGGFFCKLCHKFYNNESSAKGSHCQSQAHFEKYKKYLETKMMKRRLSEGGSEQMDKEKTPSAVSQNNVDESQMKEQKATDETDTKNQSSDLADAENTEDIATNQLVEPADQATNGDGDCVMLLDTTDCETPNDSMVISVNDSDTVEEMDTSDMDTKMDDDNEIRIEILTNTKEGSTKGTSPRARRGGRRQTKTK